MTVSFYILFVLFGGFNIEFVALVFFSLVYVFDVLLCFFVCFSVVNLEAERDRAAV